MEVRENFISYMISRRAMDYRDRGMVMPDTLGYICRYH